MTELAAGAFDGRTVLITGASRGQGAAEARAFARSGAHVVLCDVLDQEGEETARTIREDGGSAVYRRLDVTRQEDWRAAAEQVAGTGLRVLVNNAGIFQRSGRLMNTAPDDWNHMFAVNLLGAVLGTQAMAALIRDSGGGAIVNIGSAAAVMGHLTAVYSASKWGLRGLTKASAIELAPWGIRVNAVHPAMVFTAMVADASPEFTQAMREHLPLGRSCTTDEIAGLVAFLASDAASFITGVDIPFDGGYSQLGTWFNVGQRAGLLSAPPSDGPEASSRRHEP